MNMIPSKQDCQEMIIKFNSDKDIIALREKYNEPTFFEIISKQRSETTYSSFLKWMFQSSSKDIGTVSPILLLLDVLVAKSKDNQIADEIKKHIITRNFKINSIEVETEKSVSSVAVALGVNTNNSAEKDWEEDDIQKIIAKSQDRIDIFISCDVELNDKDKPARKLQIVIENKIDSGEGKGKSKEKTQSKKYDNASQTQRYYYATALNNSENFVQLYVYLAPDGAAPCDHDKYVQINYQDIVDGIILPMLASSTLSVRQRFFLEELKTELTFPSHESTKVRNNIANSGESIECFKKIWKDYKVLILSAAVCSTESDICIWRDKYYADKPKNGDLIRACMEVDKTKTPDYWSEKIEKKRITFGKKEKDDFEQLLDKLKLRPLDVKLNIEVPDLLEAFWKNNDRFLLAVMSGIKGEVEENEKLVLEKLLSDSSKRDTTKYRVYYKTKCLNEGRLNEKGANNGETAWLLVKAWLEKQNESGINVDIEYLNKVFTLDKCSSYYSGGKWLKKLFYPYSEDGKYIADGTESYGNVVDAGGWDFYRPQNTDDLKFQLKLNDGAKVIMLKMWRKDDLKKLYKHIKCADINVQPELNIKEL